MGSRANFQMAFIGAKGGVGTTASTLMTAQRSVSQERFVTLVDLTGDLGTTLGVADDLPGLAEAVRSPDQFDVRSAAVTITPSIRLIPRGHGDLDPGDGDAWQQVWRRIEQMRDRDVLIDAGRGRRAMELLGHSDAGKVLVMNCCYQALHRARDLVANVDAVLIQTDTQRALGLADMEAALGRHADGVIAANRSVSRWMDAGLILDRQTPSARGLEGIYHAFLRRPARSVAAVSR